MRELVESRLNRLREVEQLLADPQLPADQVLFRQLNAEYKQLRELAQMAEPYLKALAHREEAERLGSYIGNVLDLTRIRSGQIAPRLELVELSDIINEALRRRGRVLAGHSLYVEIPPDLPMLRLDLFLMEHAVMNVLDNAAKYSPAGSRVSIVASEQDGEVVLDIADCGSGVPAGDLERVFDAFYRGTAHAAGAAAGSGLGLAICRAFVTANGGSATMISAGEGRGATVRLRLPVPAGAGATEGSATDD